ncbi:hypothetical protein V6N13_083091 [Hibiscus sabdariffa]|uniref:Uncharacterized protein n=1 Tax=Hibiscus sabdariffa TaxID=183260 RepID=A0ABR2CER0_9ROSI
MCPKKLRAPLPKQSATRSHGRLSIADDDLDAPVPVDSAPEGPPVRPGSDGTTASVPEPVIPTAAAPMARSPPAPAEASVAANPRDSSVPSETADPAEEAGDDVSPESDASDVAADRSNLIDAPYYPMNHTETSDMLEEAFEIS